jgi:NADH dehydrogenase [ubiquinone] 1 alpha subcomplex assembly factor 6
METDLKLYDRPRYLCSLFAPAPKRAALQAVLAWNLEIARIAETVSEPMLGHIRFTWWRETLEELFAGKPPRKHPVVEALAPLVPVLTPAHFDAVMDARQAALDAPIADTRAYAEATGGALNLLCAEAMGVEDAAAKQEAFEVGVDYALAGMGALHGCGKAKRHAKIPFFRKQSVITNHWAKHPDSVARARLPAALIIQLFFR